MRIVIARTISEFSMDTYASGIIDGLRTARPHWEIIDLKPKTVNRSSRSIWIRAQKAYERFLRFPKLIQQQQADIYHIIDPAEAHSVYPLKRQNKTVVVTCHDLINFYNQENLQGSVQLPFISRYLWLRAVNGTQKADHVFAVSSATAQDTTKILNIPADKITITPNGVDTAFRPVSSKKAALVRRQEKVTPRTLCLLNVGSSHPRKNILIILKTVDRIIKEGVPVRFWKVGADFTDGQKAFISENQLEPYAVYLGKPNTSRLVELYSAADILVAPSLQEGFGLTLLESMAVGTPVITSNTSAMPEVVGDAAVLVNPKDIDAITLAIQKIYKDKAYRNSLIQKGMERANQFTWQSSAEKIAEVYEKLVVSSQDAVTLKGEEHLSRETSML